MRSRAFRRGSRPALSPPLPRGDQRAARAVDGIAARARDASHGLQGMVAVFRRPAQVVGARRRIGANTKKVVAGLDAAVSGASGQDCHVAGLDLQFASMRSAELDLGVTARNPEYL